jgi:DNA-binding protein Fis
MMGLEFTSGNQRLASRVRGIARGTIRVCLREAGLCLKQSIEDDDSEE